MLSGHMQAVHDFEGMEKAWWQLCHNGGHLSRVRGSKRGLEREAE